MPIESLAADPAAPAFAEPAAYRSDLREAITAATRLAEAEALGPMIDLARVPEPVSRASQALAERLAGKVREGRAGSGRADLVQGLLQEYALSSQEGVALMCLAEALLRIPDAATRDALIRDKIARGHWQAHLGRSASLAVNAATWGLLITGRLVSTHSEAGLASHIGRLVAKGGEPLIRKGVDLAMRMMGEHFVAGRTIDEALQNARAREAQGFRYSFDMLGEAALTAGDAERYRQAYEAAIHAIGAAAGGRGVLEGPGISIKLSALHPRYARSQQARVMDELYPVLLRLARLARRYDIGLNLDAEEADRLELSLDLLERLCFEPAFAGWDGLGFVVQAYQKRCPRVIDHLIDLARRSRRRLMVRLVKGAYWDTEIKRAQQDGQADYTVYTRKAHTDIAYVACARKLLAAPEQVFAQFATHNARTLATIHHLADPARWTPSQYEFQCLHGMGEPLYEHVVGAAEAGGLARPCRIYAPVGTHETLLAYLVRRLLENGANTSFVNRIADDSVALAELVRDPLEAVEQAARQDGALGRPHPAIPLPRALYGAARVNARGMDLADERTLARLDSALRESVRTAWQAEPMLGLEQARAQAGPAQPSGASRQSERSGQPGAPQPSGPVRQSGPSQRSEPLQRSEQPQPQPRPVPNPADRRETVGTVREADVHEVDAALACAARAFPAWAATAPSVRAAILDRAAARIEQDMPRLVALVIREAARTAPGAVAEVREAVDFLRYYASRVRDGFDNATHVPLGPVACISPWNFPLAIFVGQVSAALAAGNAVLAKPAEQTPLIAAEAVRLLWQAGVPRGALQLLPGRGETVGARLVADARVQGVLFTGSTEVARILQRTIAQRPDAGARPIPLVAETGGQNAMIVDSSALPEQVVADVLASAFDSAGQRCSALRVLCIQDEACDRILGMLVGAAAELRTGRPDRLDTDLGPVIDDDARDAIERHVERMRARGRTVWQPAPADAAAWRHGSFVCPTIIEIERIGELAHEVFGPVLHVVRYRREGLDGLLREIAGTGYGLTLGLHTRIDETIARVWGAARAGNVYVNRNMVGAVVGVQPFGGEGLSGTGPKAGGPLYLYRLLAARPDDILARLPGRNPAAACDPMPAGQDTARNPLPVGHDAAHARMPAGLDTARDRMPAGLDALARWARAQGHARLAHACERFAGLAARLGEEATLAGPTGERNVYRLAPRDAVLCEACDDASRLVQLAAVLAVGSRAVWPAEAAGLRARLPGAVQDRIGIVAGPDPIGADFDAVLFDGDDARLAQLRRRLAERPGPVIGVARLGSQAQPAPLERLVVERALSVNTAAAGGNATLMTIG